ncbi:MAG: phospholipase D-like domain-containing protein, partial [Nitrospiraceae bacterium]
AATVEIYYGPEDRPGYKMVELYDEADKYIYVAMYGITYRKAVTALVSAKKRGVDVRVISDRGRLNDRNQLVALQTLHRAGIPIRLNTHDNLMHLKQVVIDDRVNTSGSMNLSHSGHRYNDERLNVIIDSKTSLKARKKFLSMWNNHARYEKWP